MACGHKSEVKQSLPDDASTTGAEAKLWPAPKASVKMRLVGGHTSIPATIASVPVNMVFDTGHIEGVIVSESVAKASKLEYLRDFEISGIGHGAATKAYVAEKVYINIGDVRIRSEVIVIPDDSQLGKAMCRIDAIIGYTLLEHFVVRVRPEESLFELYPQDAVYPPVGEALSIQLAPDTKKISTMVNFWSREEESHLLRFEIDTGNSGASIVFSKESEVKSPAHTFESVSFGASGSSTRFAGKAHAMELGGVRVEAPIVEFDNSGKDGSGENNLGNSILSRYEAVYNLGRNELRLRPTHEAGAPFTMFENGISWRNAGCGPLVVESISPGSVAAKVGVEPGDELVEVKGKPVDSESLSVLDQRAPVQVSFRRGRKTVEITLYRVDEAR